MKGKYSHPPAGKKRCTRAAHCSRHYRPATRRQKPGGNLNGRVMFP